jgi:hypothetical protein
LSLNLHILNLNLFCVSPHVDLPYLSTMDADIEVALQEVAPNERIKRELTGLERKRIVAMILSDWKVDNNDQKLRRGAMKFIAGVFHVHPATIRRVWSRALDSFRDPEIRSYAVSPTKNTVARYQRWNHDEVRNEILTIPLFQRRSMRSLSVALNIPLSTLHAMKTMKDPVIRPHTSVLKPLLSEEHEFQRVCYAVKYFSPIDDHYDDFFQCVHVDEKWFFLTEKQQRYYLTPDEQVPYRSSRSKDHLTKVMFLAAVARPRYDEHGTCTFDGKIGMWPIVERTPAARGSVNRPRGTIITKPIGCTRTVFRRMMVENVIPAIKRKWPDGNHNITVQQDGASAHLLPNDFVFAAAAQDENWNIVLLTQPAQSPDLNVCDLSFFRALQSDQWRLRAANDIDGLIAQVLEALRLFDDRKLDFGFLTLQCCLDDVLLCVGGNNYQIRHMGKTALLAAGNLPLRIEATPNAVALARQVLFPGVFEVAGDEGDGNAND